MEQSKKDGVWMIDVVYDGKSLSDFGAYIFPVDVDKRAERRYEEVEIEGRNGLYDDDLKTFRNLDEPVYALIFTKDVEKNLSDFSEYISSRIGYKRLEDSLHPDVYLMAKVNTDIDPIFTNNRNMAKVFLYFKRMPQRYLKIGDKPIQISPNSTVTIKNPTYKEARPLIKVTGLGYFYVNGAQYQVTQNAGNLIIDSDLMDCYEYVNGEWIVRNLHVNMPSEFPILKAGENVIQTNNLTLEITPRWWKS